MTPPLPPRHVYFNPPHERYCLAVEKLKLIRSRLQLAVSNRELHFTWLFSSALLMVATVLNYCGTYAMVPALKDSRGRMARGPFCTYNKSKAWRFAKTAAKQNPHDDVRAIRWGSHDRSRPSAVIVQSRALSRGNAGTAAACTLIL